MNNPVNTSANIMDTVDSVLESLSEFTVNDQNRIINTVVLRLTDDRFAAIKTLKDHLEIVETSLPFLQKAANKE